VICYILSVDVVVLSEQFAKLAKYCKYNKVCDVVFVIFAVTFFITRLIIYPFR